jgi:hypothetical protein
LNTAAISGFARISVSLPRLTHAYSIAIALRDLVRRQRRADPRVVRDDLVPLIDQALVPDLLQQVPDALDVVVVQREVRVLEVHPEPHALRHGFPLGDMAHHGRAALVRELGDSDFLLDAPLVEDPELFLDLVLDGQAVRVPACFTRAMKTAHRLVARVEVLEGPREYVVDARAPIRRRRPFVEYELRTCGTLGHDAAEDILAAPELEYPLLELRSVVAGGDGFEHA